ncbi:MAG TPA: sigma-70 family RNA polymerase sigma factor [Anaerolineae bacterium]|nr:sigma-70 family RNA polymerase sigma factor [Anaerolineae bacterium]
MDEERAWIRRAMAGDREAFAHLVEAYQTPVYNLAYRMLGDPAEAEDAAQETFLRAYTRLNTYRPERKFSSWLLAIASHYCIDRLRRRRLQWPSLDEVTPCLASGDDQPEEAAIKQERRDEVQALLDELPAPYRATVILRYWYDLSYREIAEAMGITEGAVKSRLHRARRMLAQQLMASPSEESALGAPRGAACCALGEGGEGR